MTYNTIVVATGVGCVMTYNTVVVATGVGCVMTYILLLLLQVLAGV